MGLRLLAVRPVPRAGTPAFQTGASYLRWTRVVPRAGEGATRAGHRPGRRTASSEHRKQGHGGRSGTAGPPCGGGRWGRKGGCRRPAARPPPVHSSTESTRLRLFQSDPSPAPRYRPTGPPPTTGGPGARAPGERPGRPRRPADHRVLSRPAPSVLAAPATSLRPVVLEAVSGWVPPRVVPNALLPRQWEVDDAWVRTRTGIERRHVADPGTSTGDAAHHAARRLLDRAGRPPVDALVLATATPDHLCPATAPAVAARLGLGTVPAFDISAVCSGFVYGLALCQGTVAAGLFDRVLVVGADIYSHWLDPEDRSTGVLFGDGAGAALLARGDSGDAPGALLAFDLGSDGEGYDLITVPGGGARSRSRGTPDQPGDRYFRMRGAAVFQQAIERMTASCRTVLDRVGWRPEEVDHFVPHQANARILHAVGKRLGIPEERCALHLREVGNTGAASIPLALADAQEAGRLRPGARVLVTAFGGGLTWGSAALLCPGPAA
ncbi:ketoacyl-ACP synthase III [Streptomyces albus]|uniref:Beta-ketoacyl-[acyl-carrier-protein] synthase III n=1 Tax=Streptomyces albus TaxID=1888 RepID=A0A8H1LA40_9ACTN|nr:ketoacyl-ACP synthase III [Streptomyces albus]